MRYLIIIEATETGFSAYAPDLPGCVATGESREIVEQKICEAITLHLNTYFDASGAPDGDAALVVTGCVSTVQQWALFEQEWLALLTAHAISPPFDEDDLADCYRTEAELRAAQGD